MIKNLIPAVKPSFAGIDPGTLKGVICLLTACLFFPLGDGCAKYLSQTLPVTEVTWVRYLGNLLLLAPFTLYHHGSKGFLPQRFLAQLFRGLVLVLTTFLFFSAIQTVPITDAQIVFFINPLLVLLLAISTLCGWISTKLKFPAVGSPVPFSSVQLSMLQGWYPWSFQTG